MVKDSGWKEFLKPTYPKIIVALTFILLFLGGSYLFTPGACCEAPTLKGFPLPIYYYQADLSSRTEYFIFPYIALDIIFYYILAAVVIHIYRKQKNKSTSS
jgi:hypothetical protein